MRLVELDDAELELCGRIAKDREKYALDYIQEQGWKRKLNGKEIEYGTAEWDALVEKEQHIHLKGVTGELAFCKHFDIRFPNRMRRWTFSLATEEVEWIGDPKNADVSSDVEIRTIGTGIGMVNVKERDNPKFNVVALRKLNEVSSRFRILGYFPVGEAQKHSDWKTVPPYSGFAVPIEMLRPIELLPFEGRTLGEYECERRSAILRRDESPYVASLFISEYIDWNQGDVTLVD